MLASTGLDELLAFQLGSPVDVQRRRYISLKPSPGTTAIKHIIGRIMHQPRAGFRAGFGQGSRCQGIDATSKLRLAFGSVDGCVRTGIDNKVWLDRTYCLGQACQIGEVATMVDAVEVQRDQLTQGGQTALKLPAHLTALAEQQNLHGFNIQAARLL